VNRKGADLAASALSERYRSRDRLFADLTRGGRTTVYWHCTPPPSVCRRRYGSAGQGARGGARPPV